MTFVSLLVFQFMHQFAFEKVNNCCVGGIVTAMICRASPSDVAGTLEEF